MKRYRINRTRLITTVLVLVCILLTIYNLYTLHSLKAVISDLSIEQSQSEEVVEEVGKVAVIEQEEPEMANVGTFTITHYCDCKMCCGKTDGITATGTQATANRTIAVDPKVIPLGSEVLIDGQVYIAEDVGGAIKGNRIDIYCDSHQEALNRGKIKREVHYKEETK